MTEFTLTLKDPRIAASQLRHAAHHWTDGVGKSPVSDLLLSIAGDIEEQVKAAVQEPQGFGSAVRVRRGDAVIQYLRTYSVPVDDPWCTGNSHCAWPDVIANSDEVEVLRVGIGEAEGTVSDRASVSTPDPEDVYGQAWDDCRRTLRKRFIQLASSAITSERKDAWRQAIDALDIAP